MSLLEAAHHRANLLLMPDCRHGMAILLVEQNNKGALGNADLVYAMPTDTCLRQNCAMHSPTMW
jgi:ABC-type branched-subunit amino acid transport system ATPase component